MPSTGSRPTSKKLQVQELVRALAWEAIGLAEWTEIRRFLPDVSETVIRGAILDAKIPLAQPWRGIPMHTLDELEAALTDFSTIYSVDVELGKYCREQVIAAKNRARIISRSSRVETSKRLLKAEMLEWMLIWLGDPSLFPSWVILRRANLTQSVPS